jgi:serine/threonine protein kinase
MAAGEVLGPDEVGSLTDGPVLGRGAFGVVRLCLSSTLGLLAVKQVPVSNSSELAAAHREAAALRVCHSPFVIGFKGMLLTQPSLLSPVPHALLFLEHIPGGTLAALAAGWGAEVRRGRGLPEGVLHLYARGIVAAVAHMHSIPVAHRDIKGANLLLTGGGGVKLADFGSAKVLLPEAAGAAHGGGCGGEGSGGSPSGKARPRTAAAALFGKPQADGGEGGTVAWMAPEVVGRGGSPLASGDAEDDDLAAFWLKADIWSLGCTLLELLTGHHPWRGVAEDAAEVMLSIVSCDLRERVPAWTSPALRALICACLDPTPALRPSAKELLAHAPFLAEGYAAAAAERGIEGAEVWEDKEDSSSGLRRHGGQRAAGVKSPGGSGEGGAVALPTSGSVPAAAVARALVNCDRLRSEVRLACRHVQRWFTAGLRDEAPATAWVGSCVFSEERVPLAPFKESFTALCGAFGAGCVAAVAEACDAAAPLCAHRGCAASVVFGEGAATGEWITQVETQLVVSAVAAGPHLHDFGVLAFLLTVLQARVDAWEAAGVPLAGAASVAAAPSGLSQPTLGGIAVALQWLATARSALAQREADAAEAAEADERGGGRDAEFAREEGGEGAQHAETVPDFAVLFFARINVWIGEITVALRALSACEAAWGGAVAAAPPQVLEEMNAPALARLHQRLTRKAYARLLSCVRSWEASKAAVFQPSPRKER